MKLLNSNRMRLVVVGVVVVMVFGSGDSVNADFVIGEPVFIDGTINSLGTHNTQGHSLLHNGLKLYYTAKHGDIAGIWVSERESMDTPWGEPVYLLDAWGLLPAISPDELELYFHQEINNVFYSMRSTRASTDEDWGPPTEFNELGDDAWGLDFSPDGLTVYFDSNRSGGYGDYDIWMATRRTVGSPWGEPVNLGENVNGPDRQMSPSISNDGLTLFFQSNSRRIKMCVRSSINDDWNPAIEVDFDYAHPVASGNSGYYDAEILPDGSTLYLSSHRANSLGNRESYWQAPVIPIVDFNGDAVVNIEDLRTLTDHWDTDNSLCDIGPMPWGDGIVDVQDLLVLADYLEPAVKVVLPIAHWTLDETEGMFAADSAGDNDAIVVGGTTWQPNGGQVNGALQLNGVDGCAIAESVLNPADGPFSIFAWVKGGAPGQVVVSQQGVADWLTADAEGNLMTELKGAGRSTGPLFSETVITDGQWHRIGFAWDGSNRTLYVDGVVVADDTQPGLESSQMGLYLGVGKNYTAGTFFSGLIDDIRIYNRVVSP